MFRLFKKKKMSAVEMHQNGATLMHKSPFSHLKVIENSEPLSSEFNEQFVAPYYMAPRDSTYFQQAYIEVSHMVDVALVSKLLGEFNWRPRSVGAIFAYLGEIRELEENLGNLLLRSDVCFAGHDYCLALASFATPKSILFLKQYLNYYLTQRKLFFNQNSAMAALWYIGKRQNENLIEPHLTSWESYAKGKGCKHLEDIFGSFAQEMASLETLKNLARETRTKSSD